MSRRSTALVTTIVRRLESLRRRARAVLVTERTAVLLAFALAATSAWVALDAVARFPMFIRIAALAVGACALALLVVRWWWPAARFRPPLTELALRVERKRPGLAGDLASSVDFQSRAARGALEARAIERTERLASGGTFTDLVRWDRVSRAVFGLFAALAVPVALLLVDPSTAMIGAKRALLPWTATEWPARTMVHSLMDGVTHLPRGSAVLLRAEAVRGDPTSMRPFVRYRLVREGRPGPWRDALLAHQQAGVFERPLDLDADAVEYRFGTADALTEVATIELVTPPSVRQATLTAAPPDYASASIEPRRVELGAGVDARAVLATPILAGSTVEIDFELTRAIPVPIDADARAAWARATFGEGLPEGTIIDAVDATDAVTGASKGNPGSATDLSLSDRVRLRTRALEDLSLALTLRDQHGITSDDGARYRVPVAPDHAPSASMTEPSADEVVLPTATIRLVAEARDDVALDEIGLRIERLGAEPHEQRRRVGAETGTFERTITPEALGASAGETLLVSAVATDSFEADGVRRAPTVSPPRRIRIVGEDEFTRQIRAQLASVRQSAMRAEATQRDIINSAQPEQGEPTPAGDRARRQAQLSDRVRTMRDAVGALDARARAGGLEQEALGEIMRQAQGLLDAAGAASADAAAQLSQSAAADAEAQPGLAEDVATAAGEAQEEARAELEDLVRLLDQDEDAWVATRRIERLAQEIDKLLEETARAGERTVGRDLESLSAEERLELDRLATRDRAAADDARETLDELRDRAERLAEADRTRAAGMREAARRGEEQSIARRLDEASERTAQNQPTNAEQALREAAETAQRMMEAVQDDRRSRVEELRRRLATLEESVRKLVVQAEEGLASMRQAAAEAVAPTSSALAPLVLRIVSLDRNIGAVTDDARSASGTERVARLLERAGERSAVAAALLRADPADLVGGDSALDRSRGLLVEALELTQSQRQQAEQQQAEEKRRELAAALRTLSERQAGLRTASEPLVGAAARDRRKLVESKRLSVEQELIRSAVSDLRRDHEELASSELFESAAGRLDAWMTRSSENLAQVLVTKRTLDDQALAAETLAMMGEALSDRSANDDPFAEAAAAAGGEAGGEGEGGAQPARPAIPPVAELRLLRGTQAQLARRTRMLDESELAPEERQSELRDLAGLQQQLMEHGQAWVERLRRAAEGGAGMGPGASPDVQPGPPPAPGFTTAAHTGQASTARSDDPPASGAQIPDTRASETPKTPPKPQDPQESQEPSATGSGAAPPAKQPPTLDDLLGISPAGGARGGTGADAGSGAGAGAEAGTDGARTADGNADAPRDGAGVDDALRDRLDRSLREDELADTFTQAVESMRRSMERLGVQQDSGVETQRIQEDAVRRLDALIDAAKKQRQRQKQSSSQSSQRNRDQEKQDEESQASQQRPGDRRQDAASRQQQAQRGGQSQDGQPQPPELEDGALNEVMEEGRVEWGTLPPRIRDLVQQGRRDRVSSLYLRLTEEYYRRMAEEASR